MNNFLGTNQHRLVPPSEALALLNQQASPVVEDSINPDAVELSTKPEQTASYFGVSYGSFGVLFPDNVNKELVDFSGLRDIPNGPSWLRGFTNIRGSITPVIDFASVLSSDQNSTENTKMERQYLLAIGKGSHGFALPVQNFPQKLTFSESQQYNDFELAPEILRPFILFCFRQETPWFCISHHEFLQELRNRP